MPEEREKGEFDRINEWDEEDMVKETGNVELYKLYEMGEILDREMYIVQDKLSESKNIIEKEISEYETMDRKGRCACSWPEWD